MHRLRTFSRPLARRAFRAYAAGYILLHEKRFWHVHSARREDKSGAWVFDIYGANTRRSIDDCTPAEWDAASAAVRNK